MENLKFTERTLTDYLKEFVFFILKLVLVVLAVIFVYKYFLLVSISSVSSFLP